MIKPLEDFTIKECEEYHDKHCYRQCWDKMCPLLVANACILDLTGTSKDYDTESFYKKQGLEFDENLTVGEIIDIIRDRKIYVCDTPKK